MTRRNVKRIDYSKCIATKDDSDSDVDIDADELSCESDDDFEASPNLPQSKKKRKTPSRKTRETSNKSKDVLPTSGKKRKTRASNPDDYLELDVLTAIEVSKNESPNCSIDLTTSGSMKCNYNMDREEKSVSDEGKRKERRCKGDKENSISKKGSVIDIKTNHLSPVKNKSVSQLIEKQDDGISICSSLSTNPSISTTNKISVVPLSRVISSGSNNRVISGKLRLGLSRNKRVKPLHANVIIDLK